MKKFMVSSTSSDSHTWNLVFLELFIEERGHESINIGNCVPADLLVRRCLEELPDYLVVSSVNGHGFRDGLAIAREIERHPQLCNMQLIIGGKLNTSNSNSAAMERELLEAGYSRVFQGEHAAADFRSLLDGLDAPLPALREPAHAAAWV